ncbi:aldo/keto reductase [Naumannella halotolerans]|uniref:aldo/keto reductase n=1 Tax=Naumannella halotolerans TaxID=993414 RepID=UPI00370DA332
MRTRQLGPFTVSAIGLGGMPLSMNSSGLPPTDRAIATVHAALDAGVTFIDTADIYAPSWDAMGHNERLIAEALNAWSGDKSTIVVATKGGITRGEGETWGRDGTEAYLRAALEKSLDALQRDTIDLYQWHRPDRSLVYAQVIETFAKFKAEGLISAIGISNANVEEIAVALDALGDGGLASVQNRFSPQFRSSADELELCTQEGIAFLPWSPLGGIGNDAEKLNADYPGIAAVARAHAVSPQQVTLAWELALAPNVIPIPGASRPESITDSVKAAELDLSDAEVQQISDSWGPQIPYAD